MQKNQLKSLEYEILTLFHFSSVKISKEYFIVLFAL